MVVKVRFAPSPTGYLHLGNARMAVLNYLLATKLNGEYILRIDDTDFKRVKPEYIMGVKDDLTWLNIKWSNTFNQSDKIDIYKNFLNQLIENKRVYECFETQEELEYKKKLQLAKAKPPIYDRAMINLSSQEREKYIQEGRKPYYRLKIDHKKIQWFDMIKGDISFMGENISDPVIVREDGSFLYILTSVIDDIQCGITHVLRGEDHIVNTAVQIQMFEYLNAPVPMFAHLPLITNNDGEGFSKRDGSLSLRGLKKEGIQPIAIHNYLFTLGIGEQNKIFDNINDMANSFDLSQYNGSAAKFDNAKLLKLNLHFLQQLPFEQIKSQVKEYLDINMAEDFWNIIKFNITKFADIKDWYNVCYGTIPSYNSPLREIMYKTIPNDDFNLDTWQIWLNNIKANTNLVGKELFRDIRLILSGFDHGPELKHLICLIDKDLIIKRLKS